MEARITVTKEITLQDKFVERGQVWLDKAAELMKIKQLIKAYEENEKALTEELKKLSENIPSRSGNFFFDCSIRKGTIDYSKIPELKSIDLEQYRKEPVECWKLSMNLLLV